jgi:hypothetical protein
VVIRLTSSVTRICAEHSTATVCRQTILLVPAHLFGSLLGYPAALLKPDMPYAAPPPSCLAIACVPINCAEIPISSHETRLALLKKASNLCQPISGRLEGAKGTGKTLVLSKYNAGIAEYPTSDYARVIADYGSPVAP